jgi:hypothetical protein
MIRNGKFLFDDSGNHWACPNSCGETVCDRPAVQYVGKLFSLVIGYRWGTTGTMSLQHSFHPGLLPVAQPNGDFGTMNLKDVGNLGRRFALHVKSNGVKPTGNAVRSLTESFLAKPNQSLNLFGRPVNFDRLHGTSLV